MGVQPGPTISTQQRQAFRRYASLRASSLGAPSPKPRGWSIVGRPYELPGRLRRRSTPRVGDISNRLARFEAALLSELREGSIYVEGVVTGIFRAPQRNLVAALVTALASCTVIRPARKSSRASKSVRRNSSLSRVSDRSYLGFVSAVMASTLLSPLSIRAE